MWKAIEGFFVGLYDSVNGWMQSTFRFDEIVMDLYNQFIVPLPEIVKILGSVLLGIIVVLGVISFVKKMLKLFIGAIGQDLGMAHKVTGKQEFLEASGILEQAENMIVNEDFDDAQLAVGSAITKATTPAQQAWQVLSKNEFV